MGIYYTIEYTNSIFLFIHFYKEDIMNSVYETMLTAMKEQIKIDGVQDFLIDTYAFFENCKSPEELEDSIIENSAKIILERGKFYTLLDQAIEESDKEWFESHLDEIADVDNFVDKYDKRILREAVKRGIITVDQEAQFNAQ